MQSFADTPGLDLLTMAALGAVALGVCAFGAGQDELIAADEAHPAPTRSFAILFSCVGDIAARR